MKKTAKTGTVTDEQGRVRFHGAFTGGFSAGYFNTVGSSEGFQPAQFVSSRSNRASQQNGRSIADYMDEGDGLLGGKLSSVAGIDSFAHTAADHLGNSLEADRENLMNRQLLSELTVQVKPSDTIGKKLLATMGWRLGQGIGPRVPKKRVDYFSSSHTTSLTMEVHPGADLSKLPKSAILKSGLVTFAPDDEGKKVAIPAPKLDMYGLGFDPRLSGRLGVPSQENDYSVDLDDDDAYEGSSNTYRMSDVLTANTRGSNGHKANQAGKRSVPYGQQPSQAQKRLKYSSGFAYNDEEDDVYSTAPLALTNSIDASAEMSNSVVLFGQANYNDSFVEDAQRQKKLQENAQETLQNINQSVESWLGGDSMNPQAGVSSTKGDLSQTLSAVERCPSDNRPPLPGFHVARRPRVPPPHYPPPAVPVDFQPYHSFTTGEGEKDASSSSSAGMSTRVGRKQNPLDAAKARSDKMNEDAPTKAEESSNLTSAASADTQLEPPKKASIFDLIKPEARLKLQSAINAVNPTSQVQLVPPTVVKADKPPLPPRPATPPLPPPPPAPASLPATLPPKSTIEAPSAAPAPPARPMLTSSHLLTSTFAGLSQAFKNRFATATTTEGAGTKDSIVLEGMATASEYTAKLAEKAEIKATEDANLSAKNAPKVFHLKGSIRTVTPWAPSPLLCKRMNVRLPDIAKTSAQLGMLANGDASTLDPVRQLLAGVNPNTEQPVLQFGRGVDATAAEIRGEEEEARALEAEKLDVYQAPPEVKPDISVFKSIFEDSEDEEEDDNSEDEQESGEGKDDQGLQQNEERIVSGRTNTTPIQGIQFPQAGSFAPSAVPSLIAVDESGPEENGPVRFVPSNLRTTIANRSASAAAGGAPVKARGAARARTSFEDPDQDDDGERDIVLHRAQGRMAVSKLSSTSAASSNSIDENEETEDIVRSSNPRAASQNTVSIGGAGLAGRARKGRTAAAGSLRERLLAQQREEQEESVPDHENEVKNRNQSADSSMKNVARSSSPERIEENNRSHQEVSQSVRVAQNIINKMNSSAAEDFLADLSATTVPVSAVDVAPQSAARNGHVEGSELPAPLQEVPVPVHRPSSRFAPPPPLRPPSPPGLSVAAEHDAHRGREFEKSHGNPVHGDRSGRVFNEPSAPSANSAMLSSASISSPPPLHEGPPPPPARELPLLPAQIHTASTASTAASSVVADAVLPPAAKFETSIQRLQNSLLGQDVENERSSKKASKKDHKKSHKSHKSDKHKHKKGSSKKKDRKRDKKESSKKSKKSRHNDSSSSSDSSDGSSSESD